jgi:protein O-GlcNAc transferase
MLLVTKDMLSKALKFQEDGHFEEAEKLFRSILIEEPHHSETNYNLGVISLAKGELENALIYFALAVKSNPKKEIYWLNLISALIDSGKTEKARIALERTLKFNFKINDFDKVIKKLAKSENSGLTEKSSGLNEKLDLTEPIELYKRGELEKALNSGKLIREQNPHDPILHNLLGVINAGLGNWNEAIENYTLATELKPDYFEAYSNMGATYFDLKKMDEAISCYTKAININPNFEVALNNLGTALRETGDLSRAIEFFAKAVKTNPSFSEAFANLGKAYRDLHLHDKALSNFKKAIEINPKNFEAHNNLGITLNALGKFDEAIESYYLAIRLKPDLAQAYNNLGNTYSELLEIDKATENYRKALEIDPNLIEANNNLGNIFVSTGLHSLAIKHFVKAIKLNPNLPESHNNIGNAYKGLGRFEEAISSYNKALEINPELYSVQSNLIFSQNFLSHSPNEMLKITKKYGERLPNKIQNFPTRNNIVDQKKKLHLGFISGDLMNHPVGHFFEGFIKALSENSNRKLETYVYHNNKFKDDLTERIKKSCDHWNLVSSLTDEQLARQIVKEQIDILIDLSGHSAKNRLPVFSLKPAPIQISWLGYFATTGLKEIDYFLADKWTVPEGEETHFIEKIWRLPETYWCFTEPAHNVEVKELPALKNNKLTFGCFNNFSKLNKGVIQLWINILKTIPESGLFIKNQQLEDEQIRTEFGLEFTKEGIAKNRLIFEGPSSRREYLESYNKIDIALDPFPYPGGTTTIEGLWMGVPMITKRGDRFLSRAGETIAHNAGLKDWIAEDEDDYLEKAVSYSSDLMKLAKIRSGMRKKLLSSALFDTKRFASEFEKNIWKMWNDRN